MSIIITLSFCKRICLLILSKCQYRNEGGIAYTHLKCAPDTRRSIQMQPSSVTKNIIRLSESMNGGCQRIESRCLHILYYAMREA